MAGEIRSRYEKDGYLCDTHNAVAYHVAAQKKRQGVPIVTDTNMAKAGVSKPSLAKLGGTVACFMADGDVSRAAQENGTTRADAAMEKAAREYPGAVLAVEDSGSGVRSAVAAGMACAAVYNPASGAQDLSPARWRLNSLYELPALLDGLHFHTLCEQDADALAVTLAAVEKKFADLLPRMQWLNFGGGHHITRPGYDLDTLERCILSVRQKYGVQVYLEPGEAWALNAGYLVTTVLDTLRNGDTSLAILDMSAACHTPDVIEMPYHPPLLDAGEAGEKAHTVRLGGPTCLAGDIIGDYSFNAPLAEGDKLIFGDMAIYTTCKNNTFNGMPLPPIWLLGADGNCRELVHFGYQDFKMRLGAQ